MNLKTEKLKRVFVPAIINSEASFFFVDLQVFGNARLDYWTCEDIKHFEKDVKQGCITPDMPSGCCISIHNLGEWRINKGKWLFDRESFIKYILKTIKTLNPKSLENGNGTFYKKIKDKEINLFFKTKLEYNLVRLDIYDENSIIVNRLEKPFKITLSQLEKMIAEKEIISQPANGSKINNSRIKVRRLTGLAYKIPLILLAILASGIGFLLSPNITGILTNTFPNSVGETLIMTGEIPERYMTIFITLLTMLIGFILGWLLYVKNKGVVAHRFQQSSVGKPVYDCCYNGFGFNYLYDWLLSKPMLFIARLLNRSKLAKRLATYINPQLNLNQSSNSSAKNLALITAKNITSFDGYLFGFVVGLVVVLILGVVLRVVM